MCCRVGLSVVWSCGMCAVRQRSGAQRQSGVRLLRVPDARRGSEGVRDLALPAQPRVAGVRDPTVREAPGGLGEEGVEHPQGGEPAALSVAAQADRQAANEDRAGGRTGVLRGDQEDVHARFARRERALLGDTAVARAWRPHLIEHRPIQSRVARSASGTEHRPFHARAGHAWNMPCDVGTVSTKSSCLCPPDQIERGDVLCSGRELHCRPAPSVSAHRAGERRSGGQPAPRPCRGTSPFLGRRSHVSPT